MEWKGSSDHWKLRASSITEHFDNPLPEQEEGRIYGLGNYILGTRTCTRKVKQEAEVGPRWIKSLIRKGETFSKIIQSNPCFVSFAPS